MRVLRTVVAVGLLVAAFAALAGCSGDDSESTKLPLPSKAFCQAAYDYDTNAPKLIGKLEKQTALVQRMADHAPKDVAADAQTVLHAMQRLSAGDNSVKDKPAIKTALDNVERRAINGCALYKQNQDGSDGI